MKEFEVILSYTFRVITNDWREANELSSTIEVPGSVTHPQASTPVELAIDVDEWFNGEEWRDGPSILVEPRPATPLSAAMDDLLAAVFNARGHRKTTR